MMTRARLRCDRRKESYSSRTHRHVISKAWRVLCVLCVLPFVSTRRHRASDTEQQSPHHGYHDVMSVQKSSGDDCTRTRRSLSQWRIGVPQRAVSQRPHNTGEAYCCCCCCCVWCLFSIISSTAQCGTTHLELDSDLLRTACCIGLFLFRVFSTYKN